VIYWILLGYGLIAFVAAAYALGCQIENKKRKGR